MLTLIALLIMLPLVFFFSLFFEGIDRKIHARMQWRIGPPIIQPFYDFIKLFCKERITPSTAARGIFSSAPLIAASSSVLGASILLASIITEANVAGDLILVLYLLATSSILIMVGGSSSGNPYGAIGFSRKATLFICCELPMLISIMSISVKSNLTISYYDIILTQLQARSCFALTSLSSFIAALSFLLCIPAVVGVVPFDIPEAKTEIVYGPLIEYGGPYLALLRLAKDSTSFLLAFLASTIFFYPIAFLEHSFSLSGWTVLGICIFTSLIVMLITITIPRTIFARLKIGQAFRFYCIFPLPLATISLLLSFMGI
ncbi:MAG: complex I subunit 1 family protein [Candidatus Bathyarchaeia archaeon]